MSILNITERETALEKELASIKGSVLHRTCAALRAELAAIKAQQPVAYRMRMESGSYTFCSSPEFFDNPEPVYAAAGAQANPVQRVPLQEFVSHKAKKLMSAWQDGWEACRDSEFIGEEAQNDAFNQSSTVNNCIAYDILHDAENKLAAAPVQAQERKGLFIDMIAEHEGLAEEIAWERKPSAQPGTPTDWSAA